MISSGRFAEGGVQPAADGVAGAGGQVLRAALEQARDGDDRKGRGEEHQRRADARHAIERDRPGMKSSSQLADGFSQAVAVFPWIPVSTSPGPLPHVARRAMR